MDNHNRNSNNGKPIQKSNNAVSTRKSGFSAPVKTPTNQSVASQSVGTRNIVSNTPRKSMIKKKTGSVVGMNNHRPSSLRAVRNPKIITIRKKERTPFPIAIVFTSLIITALFLFMMMNYAELDKYNSELTKLDAKLTDLNKDEYDLNVKLDKKDNLVYIEKQATEKLGMVKSETLERVHIDLRPSDKSGILKYDDGVEGGFGFLLAGVGEVIRDFIK